MRLITAKEFRDSGPEKWKAPLVAWASVHAGNGYNVCDNGWKLPLIYLVMFLPLMLTGPGKLSLDHWIKGRVLGRGR